MYCNLLHFQIFSTIYNKMKHSNVFLICSKQWDEKSQQWNESDVTDMAKCCTNECLEPVKFCYNYCDTERNNYSSPMLKYRCQQMCEDQRNICLDTCSLISKHVSKEDNNYIKCAIDHKCASKGTQPDVNCLLKQKQNILECCNKTSIASPELDIIKHCNYLETVYLNPPPVLVSPDKDTMIESLSEFKNSRFGLESKNKKGYKKVILITIAIVLLIIFIIILVIIFFINK